MQKHAVVRPINVIFEKEVIIPRFHSPLIVQISICQEKIVLVQKYWKISLKTWTI